MASFWSNTSLSIKVMFGSVCVCVCVVHRIIYSDMWWACPITFDRWFIIDLCRRTVNLVRTYGTVSLPCPPSHPVVNPELDLTVLNYTSTPVDCMHVTGAYHLEILLNAWFTIKQKIISGDRLGASVSQTVYVCVLCIPLLVCFSFVSIASNKQTIFHQPDHKYREWWKKNPRRYQQ